MSDTDSPIKRDEKGRLVPGGPGGPGRKRKQFTEDVEHFALEGLNLKGVRMLLDAMDATKLYGKEGIEHPDWPSRIHAFEVLRDTFIGKPANVIVGEDGQPLRFDLDLIGTLQRLAVHKGEPK
jgi:hypothetical protein